LLVWHIDQGQVDQHGFDRDNRVNVGPVHGVALVQADGRDDLGLAGSGNRGDTGDAFPGSTGNRFLCRTTHPAATDNQGGFARFCLDSITEVSSGGNLSFKYISYRSVFAADHPGAQIQVNGATVSRLEQFFAPGTEIDLSMDSVQVDGSGRNRFDFLSWSDGGARAHSITAREVPDTVVAQVSLEYRLRMAVQGAPTAAITSGVTGDIASGVYLAEGSQVTLAAARQPGAVFAGWTGDTTTTADTLTLTMRHPFDLIANFVAVQEVVLVSAADALLGNAGLLAEEAAYLDALGNRNGVYDLGDFLATADRSREAR
jgi:Divergent InlB B-repeat domain